MFSKHIANFLTFKSVMIEKGETSFDVDFLSHLTNLQRTFCPWRYNIDSANHFVSLRRLCSFIYHLFKGRFYEIIVMK